MPFMMPSSDTNSIASDAQWSSISAKNENPLGAIPFDVQRAQKAWFAAMFVPPAAAAVLNQPLKANPARDGCAGTPLAVPNPRKAAQAV